MQFINFNTVALYTLRFSAVQYKILYPCDIPYLKLPTTSAQSTPIVAKINSTTSTNTWYVNHGVYICEHDLR